MPGTLFSGSFSPELLDLLKLFLWSLFGASCSFGGRVCSGLVWGAGLLIYIYG